MESWKERTELLLGKGKTEKLEESHCFIAGLGGVGAYAAEMIVRAGIGAVTIADFDIVKASNINRQIIATNSTIGKKKIDLVAERLSDINPKLKIYKEKDFLRAEKIPEVLEKHKFNYVIDAIDTLSPKVNFIKSALERNYKIISSMGAGGKLDPSKISVCDISQTYNDKLARMLRKRMHKHNIYEGFKVVFSYEKVDSNAVKPVFDENNKKTTVGTISYIPAFFGMYMAAEVIQDLIKDN